MSRNREILFRPRQRVAPDFAISRRVARVEVDQTGYVHFSNYPRYAEEAEYAFLRSRDLAVIRGESRGILGYPRVSAALEIVHPLACAQTFQVVVESVAHDAKQLEYVFRLECAGQPAATIRFRVACCRFPGKGTPYAIPLPESVLTAIFGSE